MHRTRIERTAMNISKHFLEEGNLAFGKEVLYCLSEQMPVRSGDTLRNIIATAELYDRDPNAHTMLEHRFVENNLYWLQWIEGYIKRIPADKNTYTVEEVKTLFDKHGFAATASKVYNIRHMALYLAAWSSMSRERPFMITSETWLWMLDANVIKDVCKKMGLADVEQVFELVDYAEAGRIMEHVEEGNEETMAAVCDVEPILVRYQYRKDVIADVLKTISDVTDKEHTDIVEAVKEYCGFMPGRNDDLTFRSEIVELLMSRGLYEDYQAVRSGIPVDDVVMIDV